MNPTAVALLAKAPIPGQVKTRFCPPCTPDEAAAFARAFLADTAAMLDDFADVDRWCSYAGPPDELRDLLGGELLLQRGEGLGERIANATADLFGQGYTRVIVLCADAPTVDREYFAQTLKLLDDNDVVFAPARDGGCLHVALARPGEMFFRDVEMSTDHVFAGMLTLAQHHEYRYAILPERFDLDYLSDLISATAAGELTNAHNTNQTLQQSRFARRVVSPVELNAPLVPFRNAVDIVLNDITKLSIETVALTSSSLLGRVLADDVLALTDVPPFASSSMDGYAVNSPAINIDNAPKIMTGWPLPAGYDAVVPWEHVGRPTLSVTAGQFIRPQGEDVHAGAVIMPAGTHLTPAHLGLLAACGHASVHVVRKPRVAVLVTGDELSPLGVPLAAGKIYDSDSVMLQALLERAGAEVISTTRIGDSRAETIDWFNANRSDVDVIVTAGGASVGEHDWVRTVLEELGSLSFWRVALKPGKPFAYGHLGDASVFVLPGNPASVLACSHAFVLPALRQMIGQSPLPASITALLAEPVQAPDDRTFLCPVRVTNGVATPMRAASSSVVSNHLEATGYAIVPAGGADVGSDVTVELFS